MTYLWHVVTGDLVETDDEHVVDVLLREGYTVITREQYEEVARVTLKKEGLT